MKFSEIANRLTGISTPVGGVSWQPAELEIAGATPGGRVPGGPAGAVRPLQDGRQLRAGGESQGHACGLPKVFRTRDIAIGYFTGAVAIR